MMGAAHGLGKWAFPRPCSTCHLHGAFRTVHGGGVACTAKEAETHSGHWSSAERLLVTDHSLSLTVLTQHSTGESSNVEPLVLPQNETLGNMQLTSAKVSFPCLFP